MADTKSRNIILPSSTAVKPKATFKNGSECLSSLFFDVPYCGLCIYDNLYFLNTKAEIAASKSDRKILVFDSFMSDKVIYVTG